MIWPCSHSAPTPFRSCSGPRSSATRRIAPTAGPRWTSSMRPRRSWGIRPSRRAVAGAETRRHTAVCSDCRATVDFFDAAEEALGDPDVWESVTGSSTLDSLRAHADRIAAEDAEADELLAPFFASPATAPWTNITTLKRFVTGGVARRLSAYAHDIVDSDPLDAFQFAGAAISVAEALPPDAYPARAVYEVRGTAWEERANAQLRLGQLTGALESLDRAARAYTPPTPPPPAL